MHKLNKDTGRQTFKQLSRQTLTTLGQYHYYARWWNQKIKDYYTFEHILLHMTGRSQFQFEVSRNASFIRWFNWSDLHSCHLLIYTRNYSNLALYWIFLKWRLNRFQYSKYQQWAQFRSDVYILTTWHNMVGKHVTMVKYQSFCV